MGVGAGLYMCDVVVKSSRSLSHLLMSSCLLVLLAVLLMHWSQKPVMLFHFDPCKLPAAGRLDITLFINKVAGQRSQRVREVKMLNFRRCCDVGKFIKWSIFRDVSIVKNRKPVGLQIDVHSELVAVTMSSSAAEHKCRRLDGKVAVVTASTDGFVFCSAVATNTGRRIRSA